MRQIHLILQGKGGVGKSLSASILCQYLLSQGKELLAIDTDPVNRTLTGYKTLPVQKLELLKGDDIDRRKFDHLIEYILESKGDVVVDNGAATFVPLCSYLKENQTIDFLTAAGLQVFIHTLFTGGQALKDTTDGLVSLLSHFPEVPIVIWLNRYFGEIVYDDKQFEDFNVYQKNKTKIAALIRIPLKSEQTFGRDLEELFTKHHTFADGISDGLLPVMTRQRLKIFWQEMCQELDKSQIVSDTVIAAAWKEDQPRHLGNKGEKTP